MSSLSAPEQAPSSISVRYAAKTKDFRRYAMVLALALLAVGSLWGATSILLSFQVQQLEFAHIFTGGNSGVNLQQLADLKTQVDAHEVVPTASQSHLLALLVQYNTAKAGSLSLVTSVGVFITMFIQPIIGTLSDHTRSKWGRRAPWIAGGAVVGGALIGLMPLAPNIGILVIVWSVAQLVVNIAQGPLGTTVADRISNDSLGTMSIISGTVGYGAAIVGMLLAGVLFNIIGLGAYIPFAGLLVAAVLVFLLVAKDKPSSDLDRPRLRLSVFLLSFIAALRDSDYRWAWLAKVLLTIGYGISGVYSVYMLQSYITPALSVAQAATTAPLLQFAGIPAAIVAMAISGRWSDKIGRRKPFVVAASLIIAAAFIVPFVWPTLAAMFVEAIVVNFGYGVFIVVDLALFVEVLPDRAAAGRDLGLSQLGTNLGQAIGPVVAGVTVAIFAGSYGPVWLVGSVLVALSTLAVIPIKRVR